VRAARHWVVVPTAPFVGVVELEVDDEVVVVVVVVELVVVVAVEP
jgi:hypothetical protein